MSEHERDALPAGWAVAALEKFCLITQGQSPPGSTYNAVGEGIPFFQGKAEFGDLYPIPAKWCSAPKKTAQRDDILISIRAPVGPTNLCPDVSCIGRGLAAARPLGGVLPRYVLYALRSTEEQLKLKGTGSTFEAVSGDDLKNHQTPLAPIGEQRRIVAEIEKQFTRLDAAVEALKRVQANLRRYRASVLKEAFEGRLVPTDAGLGRAEGRDYESAHKLLARILKERRARWEADQLAKMQAAGKPPKGDKWKAKYNEPAAPETADLPKLPEGWVWATFSALTFRGPQNGLYLPQSAYGSGVPILRIDDFQNRSSRKADELRRVRASADDTALYALEEGDLVINRVNSPSHLGKTLLVRKRNVPALFESNMMRLRLGDPVPGEFIESYLQSGDGRARLIKRAKWAVNQASINQTDVALTPVPIPPFAEQVRIVTEVERRLSVIDDLESVLEANLKRADRLRQAILKRAFEGKLVPQDPSDEPATVLLERIRVERQGPADDR